MRPGEDDADLTARATIRNAALRLFADEGHDAVSVRQIAATAGVSPALVLHHFGSKAGLREAVDTYAARRLDEALGEGDEDVAEVLAGGDAGSVAEVFARAFPPDSPLPAYVRRLLLSGDPAGVELFGRWFQSAQTVLARMVDVGLATPSEDPDVRAAFLLSGDLALLLLRAPLTTVLGFDPLSPEGLTRWTAEVTVIARDGMLIPPTAGAAAPEPAADATTTGEEE